MEASDVNSMHHSDIEYGSSSITTLEVHNSTQAPESNEVIKLLVSLSPLYIWVTMLKSCKCVKKTIHDGCKQDLELKADYIHTSILSF